MEGRQALPRPMVWPRMPLLCVTMFVVGAMAEAAMTFSGFYSVYTVNEARRKAEEQLRQEEFWERVSRRRRERQEPA
ncbi:hypothetical protein Esti_005978 [Eimeria stiedai]